MGIKMVRRAELEQTFVDGLSCRPVLAGEYSQCAFNYCTLKAGHSWQPVLYPFDEICQLFLFIEGTGYVAGARRAHNIEEVAVYIPNFDREPFTIRAADDLTFIQILPRMSEYDRREMTASSITLPRFRPLSQAWTYRENFKDDATVGNILIEHRNLGRLSMGGTLGRGPAVNGKHIHGELEQWHIALPGSSYTYQAGDETVQVTGGDITYTPHGTVHGSSAEAGQVLDYIWFELCEDGYPGGIE